jgi:pimeloyl-ACP methyl ester carboxylesterase
MSIKEILLEKGGGTVINMLLADRFRNIDIISEVRCPTFFVHGQQDQLIPF